MIFNMCLVQGAKTKHHKHMRKYNALLLHSNSLTIYAIRKKKSKSFQYMKNCLTCIWDRIQTWAGANQEHLQVMKMQTWKNMAIFGFHGIVL